MCHINFDKHYQNPFWKVFINLPINSDGECSFPVSSATLGSSFHLYASLIHSESTNSNIVKTIAMIYEAKCYLALRNLQTLSHLILTASSYRYEQPLIYRPGNGSSERLKSLPGVLNGEGQRRQWTQANCSEAYTRGSRSIKKNKEEYERKQRA